MSFDVEVTAWKPLFNVGPGTLGRAKPGNREPVRFVITVTDENAVGDVRVGGLPSTAFHVTSVLGFEVRHSEVTPFGPLWSDGNIIPGVYKFQVEPLATKHWVNDRYAFVTEVGTPQVRGKLGIRGYYQSIRSMS